MCVAPLKWRRLRLAVLFSAAAAIISALAPARITLPSCIGRRLYLGAAVMTVSRFGDEDSKFFVHISRSVGRVMVMISIKR